MEIIFQRKTAFLKSVRFLRLQLPEGDASPSHDSNFRRKSAPETHSEWPLADCYGRNYHDKNEYDKGMTFLGY